MEEVMVVMANWLDIVVAEERQKDRLRAAEQERLVRAALAGRPKRTRFVGRLLVWAGQRLVVCGRRLQTGPGALEANGSPAFDGGG